MLKCGAEPVTVVSKANAAQYWGNCNGRKRLEIDKRERERERCTEKSDSGVHHKGHDRAASDIRTYTHVGGHLHTSPHRYSIN